MAFWHPKDADRDDSDEALLREAFRYALSLTGAHHTAQDLVQQAAFKLFRRYGGLKNRSLVFKTVRRLFFDQLRHEKVVPMDSLETVENIEADSLVPYSTPSKTENRIDIGDLMRQLEPKERETIYLHYVLGHTAEEISKFVGSPRNTVLSRLARTREKLQQLAEDEPLSDHYPDQQNG